MSETLLDVKGMNCPLPVLRANRALRALEPGDRLRVLATDRGLYDLILADPPYTVDHYADLAGPVARILTPDGLFVLQSPAAAEPALEGLTTRTSRKYGSARLTLFEL